MRSRAATILLLVATAVPARGQVVSDTLDWRRYFPLEIGNEWQYMDTESGPWSRFRIVGDSLVDGKHYFVAWETIHTPTGEPWNIVDPRRVFLRYDATGRVAEFESPDLDQGIAPPHFYRGMNRFPSVDLRAAFGSTLFDQGAPPVEITVKGGYERSWFFWPATILPALKEFDQVWWWWRYGADVGFLGGGNLWGPALRFARVGGVEYGVRFVGTEEKPGDGHGIRGTEIHPNPANDFISVEFERSWSISEVIDVFAMDGRLVLSKGVPEGALHDRVLARIDVSSLTPGMYLLRPRGTASRAEVFAVVR